MLFLSYLFFVCLPLLIKGLQVRAALEQSCAAFRRAGRMSGRNNKYWDEDDLDDKDDWDDDEYFDDAPPQPAKVCAASRPLAQATVTNKEAMKGWWQCGFASRPVSEPPSPPR